MDEPSHLKLDFQHGTSGNADMCRSMKYCSDFALHGYIYALFEETLLQNAWLLPDHSRGCHAFFNGKHPTNGAPTAADRQGIVIVRWATERASCRVSDRHAAESSLADLSPS